MSLRDANRTGVETTAPGERDEDGEGVAAARRRLVNV